MTVCEMLRQGGLGSFRMAAICCSYCFFCKWNCVGRIAESRVARSRPASRTGRPTLGAISQAGRAFMLKRSRAIDARDALRRKKHER